MRGVLGMQMQMQTSFLYLIPLTLPLIVSAVKQTEDAVGSHTCHCLNVKQRYNFCPLICLVPMHVTHVGKDGIEGCKRRAFLFKGFFLRVYSTHMGVLCSFGG